MRILALLFASVTVGTLSAGTVAWQTMDLGGDNYRITYSITGISFLINQEFDIQFDPTVYQQLSNGVAPAGFDVLLFQPNNPPGTPGDLSAVSLTDYPDLSAGFSVDVLMAGTARPGIQQYSINQLDANGVIVSTVASGVTTAAVPEPATLLMVGLALLIGGALPPIRRRFQ